MNCVICKRHFLSFNKYIFHLEFAHGTIDYYLCPFQTCHRLYHRKHIFKKHVILYHKNTRIDSRNAPPVPVPAIIQHLHDNPLKNEKSDKCEDNCISIPLINIGDRYDNFKKVFNSAVQIFISQLYENLLLPRNAIQSIIVAVQNLLSSGLISVLQNTFKETCESCLPKSHYEVIYKMFNILNNPFMGFETEYSRFRFFEQSQTFIKPIEHKVGVNYEGKRDVDNVSLVLKSASAYYVPMKDTLKIFLELPGVYETIINYHQELLTNLHDDSPMLNIIHGSLYKKLNSENKIIFPLLLYFDDFESGNPLSSKAGLYKIGVVYYTIATLPPKYITKLENIFLALIFYSKDRAKFGNKMTFNKLIQELKDLESTGINININGEIKTVFFPLLLILGDNLGIHSLLGYMESFAANNFCRFCTTSKYLTETQTFENNELVRTKGNYEVDLQNRVGLKEECIWHNLKYFHIYENLSCDVMHDLYEGVHRYDMALIIDKLITERFFTLDLINARLQYLTYEIHDKNTPPCITKDHIKKRCIIFSASEMVTLVRNFRYAVGDLVPENNNTWKFYLILLDITDILSSHEISNGTVNVLDRLIREHHSLYIELFQIPLKPKHHFLLHYPRIIRKIGPPILLSCMRYEAKHRDFKSTAHYLRCRKNIPYSLAMRMQLKCCYRFLSRRGLYNDINFGLPSPIGIEEAADSAINLSDYFCVLYYQADGIKYRSNSVILYEYLNNIPKYGQINYIFVSKVDTNSVVFLCRKLDTINYSEHFKSYEVSFQKDTFTLNKAELVRKLPTIVHKISSNRLYVSKM